VSGRSGGFDALDSFAPDLVITDHAMPRMSGGELVSAVRKARPGVITLMASACNARLLKDDQHADARLEKPITPGRLLRGRDRSRDSGSRSPLAAFSPPRR
jgi:CheY-like chemotaxis protein